MTVEELKERARVLVEESEQIIERARQIEVRTRLLVAPRVERPTPAPLPHAHPA